MKTRVTTNQKNTIGSQKPKRKLLRHNTKENKPQKETQKEERKKTYKINWKTRFKMAINIYLPIITLNVNALNALIKRHRMADLIIKQEPTIYCLQETHFRVKDTHRLKMRGWKKIFRTNGNEKKVGVAILI